MYIYRPNKNKSTLQGTWPEKRGKVGRQFFFFIYFFFFENTAPVSLFF